MSVKWRCHFDLQPWMHGPNFLHQPRQIALQMHPEREEIGDHDHLFDALGGQAIDRPAQIRLTAFQKSLNWAAPLLAVV